MQKNNMYPMVRKTKKVRVQSTEERLNLILLEVMCAETPREKINNTLYCKKCGSAFRPANLTSHSCGIQFVTFLFGGDKRWYGVR